MDPRAGSRVMGQVAHAFFGKTRVRLRESAASNEPGFFRRSFDAVCARRGATPRRLVPTPWQHR